MQRVLHFAQDSDTSGFFPQLARWHDRRRYRMYFGTLNPMAPWLRDEMESQGVHCFSCDARRRVQYPFALLRLARFLRRERIDILHTHLFEPSVIGLLAGTLAGTNLRIMTRHYSDYHTRINKRWHVRLDQMCTRLSHKVIAVSQHTADHMLAGEQAPPEKLHVVLNGIDFARVRLSDNYDRDRWRQEFVEEGTHLLLIAARLHPEKGYEYLFEAMAKLKHRFNGKIKLLVAGKGALLEHYQRMVCSLQCDDVVTFLGFRKDLPDVMAAVDLFVLPSVAEAFGLVLAEALYLGTPVVATRVGGIPEIVDDGVDGVLVPPADSEALADAIAELLNDPARRRQMAGAGRHKVVSRFQFNQMVRAYEAIYARLITTGRDVELEHVGDHLHG
ncbi:MAG: glycosyltransferase family 4 protein [Acidobacteriota bacterium]|nr:glycosyltransferase family 4 protein [Blastocatellia bacterium]MDW8240517.1 glycosyltransferase family 4 protein [Acidobacteriota bacterium]